MDSLQVSLRFVGILVVVAVAGFILYQLSPVLLPFMIAGALAYLTDPLVERLKKYLKLPRTLGVVVVFLIVLGVLSLILFYLIPLLVHQFTSLLQAMPEMIDWLQKKVIVQFSEWGLSEQIKIENIRAALSTHIKEATKAASWLGNFIFHSGLSLFAAVVEILIIFVVTFYLLRDWPKVLKATQSLIPKKYRAPVNRLAHQCDSVLATFFRGQLVVMAVLAVFYTLGLALIGVRFSLLFGFLIGLLSIVPYLGSILGLTLALVVTTIQFQDWLPLVGIAVLFGLGNILEGMILTPLLIGDKLGLHPVAVIFAVLAGGQLLGFVGVILALPVAAILVVLFREFYLPEGKV